MQPLQSKSHLPKCEIRDLPFRHSEWDYHNVGLGHRITELLVQKEFFGASEILTRGNADQFDEFCEKHPTYNPNYPQGIDADLDPNAGNALATAAYSGNSKLVQHIITFGKVNIDLGNVYGSTPLFFTAGCKNKKEAYLAAEMLINAGVDVNLETFDESWNQAAGFNLKTGTYIMYEDDFDRSKHDENDLYKERAECHFVTFCDTPLWEAAENTNNLPLVKLLLVNGGMIYRPLSKEGQAFLNKAVTELFEKSKLFLCGHQDSSSSLTLFPIELMTHIANFRTQLILTTIVQDELENVSSFERKVIS